MASRLRSYLEQLRAHITVIAPLALATVCLGYTLYALYALTFATFGRDQGIFQYVAWALRNGVRAYRDIHEINGPLPHAWHMTMQLLGGEDEHVFRSIDTLSLTAAYALGASTIPRWVGLESRNKWTRVGWALAGIGLLGAQYSRYDWWHTSQREGLYSILVLGSLACQASAHHTRNTRRAFTYFLAASVLTSLTWFGKPPCALFAVLQAAVLLWDRKNLVLPLKRVVLAATIGAGAVSAAMIAFVLHFGDVVQAVRVLSAVPVLHHTIWNKSLVEVYHSYNNAPNLDWAMVTMAAFWATFFWQKPPRRVFLALVLPIGGFVIFAAQGKGFPYHGHMMTLGTSVLQLVILAIFVRRAQRDGAHLAYAVGVAVAALGLGVKARDDSRLSPGTKANWPKYGHTKEQRASQEYFDQFAWGDFFATDLRDAAAFLQKNTAPDDRIQIYGFDPYLLFLAKRQSATPIIYGFELNVDAALAGGSGAMPTEAQRATLLAHREAAEKLVLATAEKTPPVAFVFFDRAPFSYAEDGELDFIHHCTELARWMSVRYGEAVRFGTVRVRLRNDVLSRIPATATTTPPVMTNDIPKSASPSGHWWSENAPKSALTTIDK
jgi:hypothetical protein